eukprot:11806435-Alexandrium_andersonii.AAC.1
MPRNLAVAANVFLRSAWGEGQGQRGRGQAHLRGATQRALSYGDLEPKAGPERFRQQAKVESSLRGCP